MRAALSRARRRPDRHQRAGDRARIPQSPAGSGIRTRHAPTFRTSDHGVLRGGALIVLGRLDDVLITGGVKVDPAAVEHALSIAPGVAEVVVVGIPHAEWGSAVTAVVTREGDAVPDLDTLRALAATALGPAAAPRHLLVVPDFPTIGPGKPDRAAIRELAVHALTAEW